MTPDMVAHTFAHQSQNEARNSNGSLFFDNNKIYSYGRHFCIASFEQNDNNKVALLFTTRRYSNTTAKHIIIVEHATSHIDKIYCNDPQDGIIKNLEAFKSNIKGELSGLSRAKKPEKYINPARHVYDQCVDYCAFFDIPVPQDITDLIKSAETGEYAQYLIREAQRIEKEKKEAAEYAIKKAKSDLLKWRVRKIDSYYSQLNGESYLRLSKDGRIETSQNVKFPIETAKRTYRNLKTLKAVFDAGHPVKIFTYDVIDITDKYIKIGCHLITFKEIDKLAKKLGCIPR